MPNTKPQPAWIPSVERDEFGISMRLVVDESTFERIVERMEHPRPPTAAMLALFRK